MNKHFKFFTIILIFLSTSCHKDNPCDKLVNGVYVYPKIPEDHNWTPEQVDEYVNIPKDVLGCITTQGLIESTMNYPYLGLIYAGANPQSGYENLVKKRYRGLTELENRKYVAKYCLEKYTQMNPNDLNPNWTSLEKGKFMVDFFFFEVIYSQFIILEKLQSDEKESLIEEIIIKYELKTGEYCSQYWDKYTALSGLIIPARLMYMDSYPEFITLMESSQGVGELTMFISPTFTIEEGGQIFAITKNYLNHLKIKNDETTNNICHN